MQNIRYCQSLNMPSLCRRYASAGVETPHRFLATTSSSSLETNGRRDLTSAFGIKNDDAKLLASISASRPWCGPPCLCKVRWASSWAASSLLRSADLKVFKNAYGMLFRQQEKASTFFVFSAFSK